MMGKVMLRAGKSSTKTVAAILVLLILIGGAYLILTAYADQLKLPFEGRYIKGALTITLYDDKGNVIKVVNPDSPLAILPLSFYYETGYGKSKLGYIVASVTTDVEKSGITSYNYDIKLYVQVFRSSTRSMVGQKIYTRTGSYSSTTSFIQTWEISADELKQIIGSPQTGGYYAVIYAVVTVSSGSLSDSATSNKAQVTFMWAPDQMLSIVSVKCEASPASWYGR